MIICKVSRLSHFPFLHEHSTTPWCQIRYVVPEQQTNVIVNASDSVITAITPGGRAESKALPRFSPQIPWRRNYPLALCHPHLHLGNRPIINDDLPG